MKINNATRLKVVAKFKQPSKDGTQQYPKISVLSGYEAGTLGCVEDVFEAVTENATYDFATIYDTEYKSFKLAGVIKEVK